MRALDLDLVRRNPVWPGWLALVIGFFLVVDAGFNFQRLRGEVDDLQRHPGARIVSRASAGEPVSEQTQRELDAARRLLQRLALPWEALLRSIETSVDRDTALLAIEPDVDAQALQISGEARDYLAILNFVLRLEESHVLTRIHLLNHQIREDVAERPYLFTLAASWGGAVP